MKHNNNITKPSKEALECKNEILHEPEKATEGKSSKRAEVDFKAFKEFWNSRHDETKSAMRRLTLMSDNRKSMIRARLRQVGGDERVLYEVIDKAMASDFMNGQNGKNWVANFDWVFGSGGNFAKVLDGNYDNEQPRKEAGTQQVQQTKSLGEQYAQLIVDAENRKRNADQELTARILGMIDLVNKNPRSACRKALEGYLNDGTIERLGIDWKP